MDNFHSILPSTAIIMGPFCPSCCSLSNSVISDNSSHSMPYVFLQFFTQHSFVKISLSGILIGVSVHIFPFAVLNGFSLIDCFVQLLIFANPVENKMTGK